VQIYRFHPDRATAAELAEYVALQIESSEADPPGDPVLSAEQALARLTRAPAADRQRIRWVARDNGTGILTGVAELVLVGHRDTDLAAISITVRPRRRRRGAGTALLRELAAAAGTRDCLFAEGIRTGTPAQAFADALGFAVVQQTIRLSLDLSTADRSRWQLLDPPPGYRLARWAGRTPDSLLGSYAAARNAIREAPHGEMSFTEPDWSPERVRDEEATARDRACELLVAAAVDARTAQIAGLTCLELYRDRPELALQEDTAVLQAHRGHGLGAWMKAANLLTLTADHPEVQWVRTSNAAENEHMLRVNHQLGFTDDLTAQNREARLDVLRPRLG
jgi:GNAT superfamily N-acetyltransferase